MGHRPPIMVRNVANWETWKPEPALHIVLVNRWYPPHTGHGGIATYNYCLAHGLVKAGHKVTVIAGRLSADGPAREDDRGVEVYRFMLHARHRAMRIPLLKWHVRALSLILHSGRLAWFLATLVKHNHVDIVEFADIDAEGFVYSCLKRRCGVVVRCHTPTFVLQKYYAQAEARYSTALTVAAEKAQIRRADALTAPSSDMAKTVAGACGIPAGRFVVIPNPVNVQAPAGQCVGAPAATPERAGEDREVIVLYVGRFERAKGIEVLAHALPRVVAKGLLVRFVLVGAAGSDGRGEDWEGRLRSYFADKGVLDHVDFLGAVDEATLALWYARADVAVVPSLLYESFSYTCAQAMAAGLPVIASRIGGIPETVEHGVSGILTTPGNVEELADAICALAVDAGLRHRLGAAGQIKAQREFSLDAVVLKTLKVYERLAGRDVISPAQAAIS